MKTKKEFLEWWEDLGKGNHYNDLCEFRSNCELEYKEKEIKTKANYIVKEITVKKDRWKYPLRLYFELNNECYRIVGF